MMVDSKLSYTDAGRLDSIELRILGAPIRLEFRGEDYGMDFSCELIAGPRPEDKIGFKLDRLQNAIWEERSEDVARDISNAKQEIIAYRKIIKPERSTLRLLERVRARYLPEDLEVYFDDIVDSSERIWDQLDNYKEVVEALEQTNETVIAHNQNDILRVLTVFSVIILPLTLITGIYGMNFDRIPFSHEPHGFYDVIIAMLLISVAMLGFFRWKRWI